MYDKLGITHESDDSFRAWDKVRTEFLSTIRKLMNLDYENIVLISHEDTTKDITKKSGDKITSIKPNIADKVANKIAGMVDIVARVVVEDDDSRTLNFKSNEVIFGGGRLKGISKTQIPLDWDALCEVYDEANEGRQCKVDTSSPVEEKAKSDDSDKPQRTSRRVSRTNNKDEGADSEQGESDVQDAQNQNVETASHSVDDAMNPPEPEQAEEKPVRTRRTRKTRGTE
jgi:hypothetical protein